jgi:Flp pilus assembly protein protease CpaA
MELLLARMASAVIVAAAYMLFDIFNKRNVPGVFAYVTLGYGAALTLLYFSMPAILTSTAIALIVLGIGYLVYKAGQIGAADVIELAALSLIIPIQPMPLLMGNLAQFGIPFVVSVMIGSGIAALVIVPLYYLPKARLTHISLRVGRANALKAAAIAGAYLLFVAALEETAGISLQGLVILAVLLVGSAVITLFESPITSVMVRYAPVGMFDEGDLIAFNLMSRRDIEATRKRVKRFDRLVTPQLIKEMRAKHIRKKFPVYKEALPLALPIFIGVVLSLAFGNIFIFILPAL